jgi:hypothetical protein
MYHDRELKEDFSLKERGSTEGRTEEEAGITQWLRKMHANFCVVAFPKNKTKQLL